VTSLANTATKRARVCWLRQILVLSLLQCVLFEGQVSSQRQPVSGPDRASQANSDSGSRPASQSGTQQANDELQKGTALTRQGRFSEAIPHLLAAQQVLRNDYALEFNLSLCYVGAGDYKKAISMLDALRQHGHDDANVEDLLAQAYVGNGQAPEAITALERAAKISPQNEKLYTFVADACMDHQDLELGLKVVEMGLDSLPQSARLHYERATLLAELDQLDRAKIDFGLARTLGQGTEIGYLAASQQSLIEGNITEAVRIAREGVKQGIQNPALLEILGKALLRAGVVPDQPEFTEALNALEKLVAERPNDASAQIALGQLYLLGGRADDAIVHLVAARRMRPDQPSIYASLAKAYQRQGNSQQAQEALQKLEILNQAQAERIRSAPGERKMSYGGNSSSPK
jgi:predicted Zn-dependent protease